MGLLDSILGGATGNAQQQEGMGTKGALMMALLSMMMNKGASASQGSGGLGNILGSLTGGSGQGGGGLGSILGGLFGGGNQAGAAPPAANLEGALGGLSGIRDLFQKAGLGEHVNSWIGTGDNQPVSADQIKQAMGDSGHLGQLAQAAGVSENEAAQHLTELLPEIVNKLTPQGSIPADGGDIVGMLKKMMG
ncbi:MAG TPA: YidB family protein [Thiobacillaceae bacterium]|nr:YidB family protein [Thiobacillaceae bacterium]